eukprot:1909601-Rhodomonas_salina.1
MMNATRTSSTTTTNTSKTVIKVPIESRPLPGYWSCATILDCGLRLSRANPDRYPGTRVPGYPSLRTTASRFYKNNKNLNLNTTDYYGPSHPFWTARFAMFAYPGTPGYPARGTRVTGYNSP